ncbi:kinesin-like protein NACK1 [Tanacetum coccineum]
MTYRPTLRSGFGSLQEASSRDSNGDNNAYLNGDTLTVKGEYGDDLIAYHIPASSATLAALKKETGEGFELNNVGYELAYFDNVNDFILLDSDEELMVSICSRPANTTHIKFLHRQPDHVMAYLLAELGTRGTLDGRQRLKGTLVEKLVEETARDAQHLRNLISICEAQIQVGETALNDTSSRSQQIIRLLHLELFERSTIEDAGKI